MFFPVSATDPLDPETAAVVPFPVRSLLAADEPLLWAAQPHPYVFFLRGVVSMMYGATWAILGSFWFYGAGGVGERSAFSGWWRLVPIFSLPFIFAGLSFFLFPLKLILRARRTWYLITSRRILIATTRRGDRPGLKEFTRADAAVPPIEQRFDRLYDLVLDRRAQELPHLVPRLEAGFFGVADGPQVAALIGRILAEEPSVRRP